VAARLGWEDQGDHVSNLLRTKVLKAVAGAEQPEATNKAKGMFKEIMEGKMKAPANLQELVYSVGVREGGPAEWDWCWRRYNSTNVPSERSNLLKALGETRDVFAVQRYLDMTLNQSLVRAQDVQTVLGAVAANPAGVI
jgi:hypothetical protein